MTYKSKILLVDGMALLFRGFYATAYTGNFMLNSSGVPTNGIFGYLNYFSDAIKAFSPTHVVCCWDMGSKTFRTEMYNAYKGNRGEPPVELIPQFDLAKEVMDAFRVPNIGLSGYEADDCIGTLAKQYSQENEVIILTGDQDILQLVDDHISVAIMKKGRENYEVYQIDRFHEQKGITPKQIIDLKGLMGDTSDNYPGVKGVGEKTALKLLTEYGSIDQIINNIPLLTKGLRKKIEDNLEMLHLSRKLAAIYCDVPITCPLDEAVWNVDRQKVQQKYRELELKGAISWLDDVS
ncbi:5'-3' exonuclease [Aquibacillus sediminis]|uniref:5'-3' exonuclease n=1 Tax=Aquibacillus sediminis TaxID=2574734 RepID=UPI001109FAB8|nr:5'-3' exonuclease H3TH domain-containing protein [Aquibacillus sediminis]